LPRPCRTRISWPTAERTRIDIDPSSGERVQGLVERLYATPKATVERAKELIRP